MIRVGIYQRILICVIVAVLAASDALAQDNRIYWTEVGQNVTRIRRADLNGANVETLLFDPVGGGTGNTQLLFPTSITIDQSAGKFYYVDFSLDRISRANLDGSNVEPLIQAPSSSSLRAVALDPAAGFLYYSDFGTDTINRAPINGGVGTPILNLPSSSIPLGLALDIGAGHIYFTDNGTDSIRRVNLDGTGLTSLVTTGNDSPVNVQLDLINNKMYWVDFGATSQSNSGRIKRSNLDGSNVETLLSNLPLPEDVALDVLGGKLYWTDGIADTINSANLDGSSPQVILSAVNGLDFPFALTVNVPIPEPTGASVLLIGVAALLRRRRR